MDDQVLARQLGNLAGGATATLATRFPLGSSRWRVRTGPRSSPASRGIMAGRPRRPGSRFQLGALVLYEQLPVDGARAGSPAGGIMAGYLGQPRRPSGGGRYRCGRVPELARQPGEHGRGACGATASRYLFGGSRWRVRM